MDPNVSCSLERLRLAAALVHVARPLTLSLWPDAGPVFTVSSGSGHGSAADMGACGFRKLVSATMRRGEAPVGPSWLFDVGRVTVEGVGSRHVGSGVVAVAVDGHSQRWWWASTLGAERAAADLRSAGAAMLDDPDHDSRLLAEVRVSAYVDTALGVTVLALDAPSGDARERRHADRVARHLANECRVQELLVDVSLPNS